ncbi:MAG: DUF169 domain-containing protein [Deltaproteobacteria bacterium]|nr:DUF169 domain-containing protein [Deltaproteobacteria bacterium]
MYYSDDETRAPLAPSPSGHSCFIGQLQSVRKGGRLSFKAESLGCGGAQRYIGFTADLRPNFEYFLSCGIPGTMEGERYKKSPDLVKSLMKKLPAFEAPGKFLVASRWDFLEEADNPDVAIFFATPDTLSGLFTLSGFDEADANAVIAPFSAGCGSIVQYPFLEARKGQRRAVLGLFDVSARPYVAPELLTFAVPMVKFITMINDMKESFLTTPSWRAVRKRIVSRNS